MTRITKEIKQMLCPPLSSFPSPPSSSITITPLLLLIIVIFAVIFFIAGLLHLLVRFLTKPPSFSPIYHSNRNGESHGLQRQLQQLFRLHDSGVDQSVIDALPVFYYKDVMGLKAPFDCSVCLCEFSDYQKLRLIPTCTHAFHIDCIDTWLLSNSTCPLCRGILSTLPLENQNQCDEFISFSRRVGDGSEAEKPGDANEKRVFSVSLGKLRSINNGGRRESLDGRRCYSMGAYQYVVCDSLQLTLSPVTVSDDDHRLSELGKIQGEEEEGSSSIGGDGELKRIRRIKGESFSVSKIWLWS